MKQKDLNYYVGKKGYTDVIQLPAPGAQPQRYALDILESFENICYAKAYNNNNTHTEYHVYFIDDNNKAVRARNEGIFVDGEGEKSIVRFSGKPNEIKDLYDQTVDVRKQENLSKLAKQLHDKEVEAAEIKALKEAERIKLLQNARIDLRADVVKQLSTLTLDKPLTKVLGDKKVKSAVDTIVMIDELYKLGLIL